MASEGVFFELGFLDMDVALKILLLGAPFLVNTN